MSKSGDSKVTVVEKIVETQVSNSSEHPKFIFIKSNKKNYKVNIEDIFYIEALGDYIKVHTKEQTLITYLSMKKIEAQLPTDAFVRIHKSFIVNIHKIKSIEGNMVEIKNEKITIGSNYKQAFQDLIDSFSV